MRTAHQTVSSAQEMGSERTRTFSSDSGCDVQLAPLKCRSTTLETIVKAWKARLVKVVEQEANRAEEITQFATEALRLCDKGAASREDILERWRGQMKGVLNFTNDLVECVNNDTKDTIFDIEENLSELEISIICDQNQEEVPNEIVEKCHKKEQTVYGGSYLDETCDSSVKIEDVSVHPDYIDFDINTRAAVTHEDMFISENMWKQKENKFNLLRKNTEHYWDEQVSFDLQMNLLIDEKSTNPEISKPFLPQFSWDLEIIFVTPGKEKDVLTNWNVWDKFGEHWEDFREDTFDTNVKDNIKYIDFNIKDIFWNISQDIDLSRREPSHLNVFKNLPVCDSPDIFLDSYDAGFMKKEIEIEAMDPINIFDSMRHIFVDSERNVKNYKYNYEANTQNKGIWNDSHKFGHQWESIENTEHDYVLMNKKVCIMQVFWKISLNDKLSRSEPSQSSIIFNLPVSDWPDIVTVGWDTPDDGKHSNYGQKEPVNIFKKYRHIFSEPESTKYKQKYKDTINGLILESSEWVHCEKHGIPWEFQCQGSAHEDTLEYLSVAKNSKATDIDVRKVFWDISMDEMCCTKHKRYSDTMKNFPVWFGPDVFEDPWDLSEISESKVVNQNEFDIVNVEGILSDWFVNIVNGNNLKRAIQPDGLADLRPRMQKKLRADPEVEMANLENTLLEMLENWTI